MAKNVALKKNVKVVYPAHGVGKILGQETQLIGGMDITAYVVEFERDKMILRIPVNRAERSGLRALVSKDDLHKIKKVLGGKAKQGRGMWSRRAKEYETKINSGNIILLAEVVRDLHKNVEDPDRSYSERVIYENALARLAGEFSAVQNIDVEDAEAMLVKTINDNQPKKKEEPAKVLDVDAEFDEFEEDNNDMEEAA